MASESASESTSAAFSSADYIQHHLTNLTYGQVDGVWQFAENSAMAKKMGFWSINVGLAKTGRLSLESGRNPGSGWDSPAARPPAE